MSDDKRDATTVVDKRQAQAALKQAWEAVPQEGGNKGFVVDANKETPGILAITEDGTLVLKRTSVDDFVVVSGDDVSGWRISPYNESQNVRFKWVTDLLH